MLLSFICFNFKCGFKQKVKVNFQLGFFFFFFQLCQFIVTLGKQVVLMVIVFKIFIS